MRTALALLLLAACAKEAPPAPPVRTPIAVEYVRGDDALEIHAAPSNSAPVIARYGGGESVSVLSRRGEWSEVRTADGSGWAHASGLATAAESKATESDNVTPRFRKAPAPVTEPGAHGEIRLEASVNSDGEIVGVKVEQNTTGSPSLLARNIAALQRARFVPIVQHGKRMPFVYEYHVGY